MSNEKSLFAGLRPIDRKRVESSAKVYANEVQNSDIWFTHSIFAQCFLPYRDPKTPHWIKRNGKYSLMLSEGPLDNPNLKEPGRIMGLPYGSKPRLFQNYYCTLAIRHQSKVIPVERSMTAMIKELQIKATGGKEGTIRPFKEQVMRYAATHFRISGPDGHHLNADPFEIFKVWFPENPDQKLLWPEEIILSDNFYNNLKDHAIPFNFSALIPIKNNSRAQDIYLWMTQRLYRISYKNPLPMTWEKLFEEFGGGQKSLKAFRQDFNKALLAARSCYPEARIEPYKEGWFFYQSPPPIRRTNISVLAVKNSG